MIDTLEIENFKSLKHLKLDCKKINIFIGKPNTGKSNILEALGLLSFGGGHSGHQAELIDYIRLEKISNLFYDEILENNIVITFNNLAMRVDFIDNGFKCVLMANEIVVSEIFNYNFNLGGTKGASDKLSFVKFYRFIPKAQFLNYKSVSLTPPSGENLLAILINNKEIKSIVSEIFNSYGLKLGLRPQEGKIDVFKEVDGVFIFYPYQTISDTLKRLIFYLTAIYSNKDSVLVFEEPESHAFPYYTKYMAELIAINENNNQYFIATHNPYILLSILEKAPKEDVGVFVTYFEDYQTKVKQLSENEKQEVLDLEMDVFFNIERFLN